MITVVTPTIRGDEALRFVEKTLEKQTFRNFEWLVERHSPLDPPDFNAAMNRMLKRAKGELIVFLQDYTRILSPLGLSEFWQAHEESPTTFFTAPLGKTQDFETFTWDWRKETHEQEMLEFNQWEIDWACAPLYALKEIGGFDEHLDKQWGFDNVNVAYRAHLNGFIFRNLPDNLAAAIDHDEIMEHPYRRIQDANLHNTRLDEFQSGLKINFL